MSSQKTLGTAVAVLEQLPPEIGEKGLILLPCIVAHFAQIVIDALLVSRWALMDRILNCGRKRKDKAKGSRSSDHSDDDDGEGEGGDGLNPLDLRKGDGGKKLADHDGQQDGTAERGERGVRRRIVSPKDSFAESRGTTLVTPRPEREVEEAKTESALEHHESESSTLPLAV